MWTSRSVLGLPKATKRKNNFLYVQYIFFSPSVISHQSQPGVSHRACSSLPASSLFKEVTRSHTRTTREKRRECLRLALLAIIGELARRLPPPPLPLSSIITRHMHSRQTRCTLQCEQWNKCSPAIFDVETDRELGRVQKKSWGEDDVSKIQEGKGREQFPLSPPFPTLLTHPSLPALLP